MIKCKKCGCNFIEGGRRTNEKIKTKKILILLMYGLGRTSMRMIAKILRIWPLQVSYWLVEAGVNQPDDRIRDGIKEIEIDKIWHFVKKKTKSESSKLLTGLQRENYSLGYR